MLVVDNSLRETSIAACHSQTCPDKMKIWRQLDNVGIEHRILGSFGSTRRQDDNFVELLLHNGKSLDNCWAFSEFIEDFDLAGKPDWRKKPTGLQKMKEYGISNPIFEIDLSKRYSRIQFDEDVMRQCGEFLMQVYEYLSASAKIMVNIRDFCVACEDAPERISIFIQVLGSMPIRPFALMFEDPDARSFPWQVAANVRAARGLMDSSGWRSGHFLVHMQKGYGLAEACVLEALSNGATGIWCGLCEEGPACGQSASITTLINLARLGNDHVKKTYNLVNLREAAITATKVSTEHAPSHRQEVYGGRALQFAFGEANLEKVLALANKESSAAFTSPEHLQNAFRDIFDKELQSSLAKHMQATAHLDMGSTRRTAVLRPVELGMLYMRVGGVIDSNMRKTIKSKHESMLSDPMMKGLKDYFEQCAASDDNGKKTMKKDEFAEVFMKSHFATRAELQEAIKILEATEDKIAWESLELCALWYMDQARIHEEEEWQPSTWNNLLHGIMSEFLAPEVRRRQACGGVLFKGDGGSQEQQITTMNQVYEKYPTRF